MTCFSTFFFLFIYWNRNLNIKVTVCLAFRIQHVRIFAPKVSLHSFANNINILFALFLRVNITYTSILSDGITFACSRFDIKSEKLRSIGVKFSCENKGRHKQTETRPWYKRTGVPNHIRTSTYEMVRKEEIIRGTVCMKGNDVVYRFTLWKLSANEIK